MQPVVRRHTTDANVSPPQNFLPNKRDHYGVMNIMVGRIASRNIFESKLRSKAEDRGIFGL
jgi:hypothetical protein